MTDGLQDENMQPTQHDFVCLTRHDEALFAKVPHLCAHGVFGKASSPRQLGNGVPLAIAEDCEDYAALVAEAVAVACLYVCGAVCALKGGGHCSRSCFLSYASIAATANAATFIMFVLNEHPSDSFLLHLSAARPA